MRKADFISLNEQTIFNSVSNGPQRFSQVFDSIVKFIKEDPTAHYNLSIGSDSQTTAKVTMFVTCIIIHRVSKGAIGFYTRQKIGRPVKNLREKLAMETMASLQLTYLFDENRIGTLFDILSAGNGDVRFEFHIDIGENGPTRAYISEMVGMARCLYFVPRIKPESYCASSYADKHSKSI